MKYILLSLFISCNLIACTSQKVMERSSIKKASIESTFAIPNDGKHDVYKQLQALIDSKDNNRIVLEPGDYRISKSLVIPSGKIIEGAQANLYYNGTGAAIYFGQGSICWRASVNNLNVFISGNGAKGIDGSWGRACNVTNCVFTLKESNQVGIYLKGIDGKSPYQNVFNTSYISGTPGKVNQTGIKLVDGGGAAHASGPNRNIFSNFKQIATVNVAVDIESGDGNIFSELNTENITDFHFLLNNNKPVGVFNAIGGTLASIDFNDPNKKKMYTGHIRVISGTNKGFTSRVIFVKGNTIALERPAEKPFDRSSKIEFYSSKATNNIITNTATESRPSSVFAKLCMGASSNTFNNNYITSIGSVKFIRECEDNSNQIGNDNYLVFNLTDNSNKARKSITPKSGFIMPFSGFISGVTISGSGVSKRSSAEVILKRSGLVIEDLTTKLINDKNVSSTSYLKKFDTSSPSFAKAGQQISIELLTDNNWNQSSEIMVGIILTRI